jgi:hypothetical protein
VTGYRGWHGVTDPSGSLICVSYEPIEGSLACKFTGGIYIFEGVPENKYQCLIRSKFAGSYFRKQIKDKYPCIDPKGAVIPAKLDESGVRQKQAKQAKQWLEEAYNPTLNLFGEATPGPQAKQRRKL